MEKAYRARTALLESAALSEVEQRLGRAVYERRDLAVGSGHAADYRNGYRSRRVQTAWTTLRVRLPRLRLSGYVPSFLVRRHRAVASVGQWVYHALLSGVSRSEEAPRSGLARARSCGRWNRTNVARRAW